MPDQSTPKPSGAAALAGILAFIAGLDALVNPGRSAEGEATAEDHAPADGDETEPRTQFHTFTNPAEARADFLATNRELIEEKAVAIIVLSPRDHADVQATVMTLPGMCAFDKASALHQIADSIASTHRVADCPRREETRASN